MKRAITTLSFTAVLGFAAPVLAGGGVTLSNPKQAKKVKAMPQGVTLAASSPRHAPLTKQASTKKSKKSEKSDLAAGMVLINVDRADLLTEVLPQFKEQVGVRVRYRGAPRNVTLRLTQPVAWEEALELIARFTNTHVARDKNGVRLKDKWGGEVDRNVDFDDLEGQVDDVNRSVRASANKRMAQKYASFRRKTPISRQPTIPTVRMGGGTLVLGPRGGGARPYVGRNIPARPYVSAPYVSRNVPAAPYVARPLVSRNLPARRYTSNNPPARPYVSRNVAARPYVSAPYVSRNVPARPYVSNNR